MKIKSHHPFHSQKIYFPTKHQKEKILAPLFARIGLECEAVSIDTDQFGTFSGEIERTGSVLETLRKKIKAGLEKYPEGKIFLASEGSFGPHPAIPFIQTDLELLLLFHVESGVEIIAEHLSTDPIHAEIVLERKEEIHSFLQKIFFPDHAVIVHPHKSFVPIFKGLQSESAVIQAIEECRVAYPDRLVVVETDLRACYNLTRREAILEAGKILIEKLNSFCPLCHFPGFGIVDYLSGLRCSACGEETKITKEVKMGCVKCSHFEWKPRPDGIVSVDPAQCNFCNP